MRVYFSERQRFNQPLILIAVIGGLGSALGLVGYGLFSQLLTGEPWGDNPMSDTGLIFTFLMVLGVAVFVGGLLFSLVLITEVRQDGIRFRFPPLINKWKTLKKEDIKSYNVRKYSPIWEYGGWGIRVSMGKGKAYNVRGNIGMQLVMKDGKAILLGTQKGSDFNTAMNKIMNADRIETEY